MSNYVVSDVNLTAIANAIRTKGGTSASLAFPAEFVTAINAISGGGGSEAYETKELTFASKPASTVTISHGLGRMPKFAIIAIKTTEILSSGEDRYRIALLMCTFGIGAESFNTASASATTGKPFFFGYVNNNTAMYTSTVASDSAESRQIMTADSNNVYVGGAGSNGTQGHLGATTYEVIIG